MAGESPESEKGQEAAKEWWDMVMDFTGGDMSLLPALQKFNENKNDWRDEWKEKQSMADEFISKALGYYFSNQGMQFPEEASSDE
jgi:hypothetical protein